MVSRIADADIENSFQTSDADKLGAHLRDGGISRQAFLKYCAAFTSLMALRKSLTSALTEALAKAKRQSVIWLSFQDGLVRLSGARLARVQYPGYGLLCGEALEEALSRYGRPAIFNSGQEAQLTSEAFTGVLKTYGVAIRTTAA